MIKTGYYTSKYVLADDYLEKVKNPFWKEDLDLEESLYEDARIFLQGSCHLFAYALSECFGYEIIEICNNKCVGNHYYCVTHVDNIPIYIDVRGATGDWMDFIIGAKYIDASDYRLIKHKIEEKYEELNSDGAKFGYKFAQYIISEHIETYGFSR